MTLSCLREGVMEHKPAVMSCLRGLSVGDAFGFKLSTRPGHVARRELPEGLWYWSDDAAMACGLVAAMDEDGELDPDRLFAEFVRRYELDPRRGYGSGMKKLLGRRGHEDWREVAPALFEGTGSKGNGASMRVPPLGAWWGASDLAHVAALADRSARVTHAHPEGVAGAVAVAIASAIAGASHDPDVILDAVLEHTPSGALRDKIASSRAFDPGDLQAAADALGNGWKITALDTVPLCVWWAAHSLSDYVEAMWQLVAVGGDEDTNCAIVGGILGAGGCLPPQSWIDDTEPLPTLAPLAP